LTPPEARQKVIELTRMVECEEAIGKIEDRTLPGPAGPLSYRVYTPVAANDEPSGGVIFFHGGAWVLGNLDTHDCFCRILANESGHVCHEHMIHHFYAMAGAIPYARTALKAVGADIKAVLTPVKALSVA
jgi:hypothetical protein